MEKKRKRNSRKELTVKERAQKDRMNKKASAEAVVNLCDTCVSEFPICSSDPIFGAGETNDNVRDCDAYIKTDSRIITNRRDKSAAEAEVLALIDEEAKALRLMEERAEEEYHERRFRERQGGI